MRRAAFILTALAGSVHCSSLLYAGDSPVLYVATTGSDSWSGRLLAPNNGGTDGPLATLEAARAEARKLGKEQPRSIVLQAGHYFLDKTLELTGEDTGLTIESAPDARACLIGGRMVTGWKKDGERFYSAALPGVKEGKWDFRTLVVNGRYCGRARLPEKGTFTHLSSFDVPWMTTTGGGWKRKPTNEELTTLKYKPGDLGEWLDVKNAEITVYHMWDESLIGLAANDTQSQTLTFSSPSGHPPGAFGVKKYVVWNIREGMTQPGQWYLDRSAGKVVYWPLPGEDMSKAEVFAPNLDSIIKIRGGRDITIRRLALMVTTTPLKAGGFGAGAFDGAISISSAENCRLSELEITNVGGQGVKASGMDIQVERCHVHHTGACGIKCSGTRVAVTDNHIHDIGLTYPSALALQGGGRDGQYSHNEIHDAPYTAINCGGQNNRIEGNLIYRAMTELHDGGGIYCFAGNGLVLRGNFIRDIIDTGGYGASAYYLDERSENCIVEGNLSVGIVRPSHNHMAKNNCVRNNVFVSDKDMALTFPRSSG
ncbi:MAG: right-handed parallel beta-helix repeat-containing protein, partial [Sedimentisphaerales bacterium]|nr:right-handed parallel beta-helix repeat-containing protein [Sedimentisphaerales bacterium]